MFQCGAPGSFFFGMYCRLLWTGAACLHINSRRQPVCRKRGARILCPSPEQKKHILICERSH